MTLLLLGGTADARKIATQLHQQHIPLIYSVAGLVRVPNVDCPVVSGGFRQFGGLKKYIAQQQIRAILDVTHPYADTMSSTAACVAAECGIPYWRFHRPEWQASDQDTWHSVRDWSQLLPLLASKSSVLLTVGQIDQSEIDELAVFHRNNHQTQVLRTAVKPKSTLAPSMTWVKAIGPFELTDELALMKQHKIDALVTKNSGGSSTIAKLEAARQLTIPVFMLERPPMPSADALFSDLGTCQAYVLNNFPLIKKMDMSFKYETNPQAIEQGSFRQIRELTDLTGLSQEQQQVVMRIVHSIGMPEVASQVRFSAQACERALSAIDNKKAILCDVEMVRHGITKRMVTGEPLCFLNDPRVPALAKERSETRTMAALQFWYEQLEDSIVLIGNAPTALFRLLEMIEQGAKKPAVIIGMPVGFVGAAESKEALWQVHEKLGIECITLLGRQGGSAVTSATLNALLRCHIGEWY